MPPTLVFASSLWCQLTLLFSIKKFLLAFVFGLLIVPACFFAIGTPWIEAASCPVERVEGASVLINGKIYVFSGFFNSSLNSTTRVDVYSPKSNTWDRATDIP